MKIENPTRHKLQEAEYFLSKMEQTLEDDKEFYYNLSAFLAAARSITYYMQKQYRHRNGFSKWYCPKQIDMEADPELKYLNKARAEAIHTETIETGATRIKTSTLGVTIVEKDTPEAEQVKEVESKPSAQSRPRTVRRFFPEFKDMDVIEFGEKQLAKLTKIVEECEKRFP
nr:hypothetical protein BSM_21360 [uncultured archaeon]